MNKPKQLYDKEKVIGGLVIFVILFTFPVFYNHGKFVPAPKIVADEAKAADGAPVLVLTDEAKAAKECVREKAFMKTEHMQLLNEWRDDVVRNGYKMYKNPAGKSYDMSLSNNCLSCHSNKAEFCDKCHNYTSVAPYCFDCHIDNPKGEEAK